MVKWLQWHEYSAEEFETWLGTAGDWKTLSVDISISNQERGRMGSTFYMLFLRYSGLLKPIAPLATRLWETFTIIKILQV